MRRLLLAYLLAVVMVLPTVAAPKTVPLKVEGETVLVIKSLPFKVVAPAGEPRKTLYAWDVPATFKVEGKRTNVLVVKEAPKGTHTITVEMTTWEKDGFTVDVGEIIINVGEVPPEPGPGPKPPTPPEPTPAPKSFNILILFEEQKVKELTAEQRSMIYGKVFHDTLNANTPMGEKGTHEWRIYDQDVDLSNVPAKWESARKRAKASKDFVLPWLILFDGETDVFSGPLNKTRDETIALINKYAPKKRGKK